MIFNAIVVNTFIQHLKRYNNMKWNRLYRESLDVDTILRDAIKADPTGAALAISSLMDGLVTMGNESGLLSAIELVSDRKFAQVLRELEREKWDNLVNG